MKIFVIIIIVFLPLFLYAEYENDNSIIIDSVKYYMATDKLTYLPGDSVHMCYRVTNYKSSTVVLAFPSTQEFDFYVTQDTIGIWMWSWGKPFFYIVWFLNLYPEDSFEATCSWNMTNYYGNPIPDGDYEVTGFLASYNNLPLSVDIEYLPAGTDEPSMPTENPTIVSSPNPFTSSTNISFSIPHNSNVNISVYNLKGQKVKSLTNDRYGKGNYTLLWNARDQNGEQVSPGVYFYKLATDGELVEVKKCLILR